MPYDSYMETKLLRLPQTLFTEPVDEEDSELPYLISQDRLMQMIADCVDIWSAL